MDCAISGNGSVFMMKGNVEMGHFVSILAASIIEQIGHMPTEKEGGTMPLGGAGKRLLEAVNWADHGHMNTLQIQVEFLYVWVGEAVLDPLKSGLWLLDGGQIGLIVKALYTYQSYKTKVIEWQEEEHGEGFGSGTIFNKKDWSDRNQQLIAYLKHEPVSEV